MLSSTASKVRLFVFNVLRVNILVYRAIPSSPLVFGKFEAEETENDSTIKLLNLYGSSHYDLLLPIKSITPAAICQCKFDLMLCLYTFITCRFFKDFSSLIFCHFVMFCCDGDVCEFSLSL